MHTVLNLEQQKALLDNMRDAVVITDLQFHILSWNAAAAAMYGWQEEEVLGKSVNDVISQYQVGVSYDEAAARLFNQGFYEGESVQTCRDGRQLYVWAKVTLLRNKAGEPVGVVALNRDVTDRKQIEEALSQRLAMEQFVAEMAARFINLPFSQVDAAMDDALRLAAGVAGAVRSSIFMFYDDLTRITNTHEWCADPADSQKVQLQNISVRQLKLTMMRFAAGENLIISRPQDVENIPGLNTWMSERGFRGMLFVPMFSQGKLVGALGFFGPVGVEMAWPDVWVTMLTLLTTVIVNALQRKQAGEQRRAYALELERSNHELQEFAFVASHDLQEPLRKILAFSERLHSRYGERLDERGLDYLQRLERSAVRMQSLLDGLLLYSRVQTQDRPFEQVNLTAVLHAVLSDLEVQIERVNGRVTTQPLPIIEADATQMRQLFQNLISNALKFHRPGAPPEVDVRGERVEGNGRDMLEIRVSDNGIGFEPQDSERIFGVFHRLHGRGEYEGSGLGLAICRQIVLRHFGHMTAQGAPNNGAVFVVQLPFAQLPPAQKMI
ncbi:MAG TPA: PAS domain S-box protein [Chloroflexota bacterium]|nr:PAS domain S-box protein [Chloroflexota bacterium]